MDSPEYRVKFEKAAKLLDGDIDLDGMSLPRPGFFERRKLRKALVAFQEAAEASKENAAPLLLLGKIEERLGNLQANSKWLKKANEVEPNNLVIVLEFGASLAKQGFHQEAADLLAPMAEAHPNDPRVHCNLALSLLLAGDAPSAVAAFEHVFNLEPEVQVNQRLLKFAVDVSGGLIPYPKSEADIARYV